MILRDVALWVWRTAAARVPLAFASGGKTGQEVVSIGMYTIAAAIAINYAGAPVCC
jgi:hypothetical protein